jgi:LysM repeat protein
MDRARVWIVRLLAPLAFIGAATGLVIIVQRALDNNSSGSAATTQATLPDTVQVTTEPATGTGTTAEAEPRFYRVKQGDTLEGIAAKFTTTVDALLALNDGLDPLALQPGERIRVA